MQKRHIFDIFKKRLPGTLASNKKIVVKTIPSAAGQYL